MLVLLLAVPVVLVKMGFYPLIPASRLYLVWSFDSIMNPVWRLCAILSVVWSVAGVWSFNRAEKAKWA